MYLPKAGRQTAPVPEDLTGLLKEVDAFTPLQITSLILIKDTLWSSLGKNWQKQGTLNKSCKNYSLLSDGPISNFGLKLDCKVQSHPMFQC